MHIANTTGGLMLQTMLYLANYTSRTALDNFIEFKPSSKSNSVDTKCYGVYGCFPINGPWSTKTRQINVHPQRPSEIAPNFILHTNRTFDKPRYIDLNDPDDIHRANINPHGKLFFISHGYLERGDIFWMLEMGKMLLNHEPEGKAAVVLIDWGQGSSPPYVQAAANIRLVGAITAHVIHMIYEEVGLVNLDNVHIIGHSLGSHLAGYAGQKLQEDFNLKLGRITGLDPAAPLFEETQSIVRLDRSDANFVDIIHSDGSLIGGLGIYQRIGHVDFYPNGGMDNPGCDGRFKEYMRNTKHSLFENVQKFVGCNHVRSYQFFIESIQSKCPFMGITCDTFEDFKEGHCSRCNENGNQCLRMGYHSYHDYAHLLKYHKISDVHPPVVYLMTGHQAPFCKFHYKITVRVAAHEESTLHGGEIGTVSIRLHGKNSKDHSELMKFSTKSMYFEPGYEYTSIVIGKEVKYPIHATLFWEYETSLFNPLTWRLAQTPHIYISYVLIECLESPYVYLKLCPLNEQSPIIAGTGNVVKPKYCSES